MLMIRLQRVGRKHDPSFRVVAVDSREKPKSGNIVEVLGFYDARKGKMPARLDGERINHWISVGAQLSGTVRNLAISKKIIQGAKVDVLPRKKIKAMDAERATKAADAKAAANAAREAEKEAEKASAMESASTEAAAEVPAEAPAEEISV